jgi:vacuolar-type H+-ATPase subunit H
MRTPQELALEYTKKLGNLFDELLQTEKESTKEEREQVYAQSQTRIHRLIDNYFKKLRPAKDHE